MDWFRAEGAHASRRTRRGPEERAARGRPWISLQGSRLRAPGIQGRARTRRRAIPVAKAVRPRCRNIPPLCRCIDGPSATSVPGCTTPARAAVEANGAEGSGSGSDAKGAAYRLALVNPPCGPNAFQCAGRMLAPCYDPPRKARVLWRARVHPTSTAGLVRVQIRLREVEQLANVIAAHHIEHYIMLIQRYNPICRYPPGRIRRTEHG